MNEGVINKNGRYLDIDPRALARGTISVEG